MKNFTVRRYEPADSGLWNSFIANAKNATFLFHRDFMEYHSDRFADFSMLIFDGQKLISVLAAHIVDDVVFSHQGLTYGGFVYGEKMKLKDAIGVFRDALHYLSQNGISKLFIKTVPSIYHKLPSDEMQYAFFVAGARLVRRDSLSVVDRDNRIPFTKSRKQSIRRGVSNGLLIVEEAAFEVFWNDILIPNLGKRHGVKPVHSLDEIIILQQKFPDEIRHFNVYHEDKLVAGTTVFVAQNVAHPQYISGQQDKNELGSLDFLYHHLITDVFSAKRYFDFGISNEGQGKKLNEDLVFWKESFGARTITQDFYETDTANYKLLDQVLI